MKNPEYVNCSVPAESKIVWTDREFEEDKKFCKLQEILAQVPEYSRRIDEKQCFGGLNKASLQWVEPFRVFV